MHEQHPVRVERGSKDEVEVASEDRLEKLGVEARIGKSQDQRLSSLCSWTI